MLSMGDLDQRSELVLVLAPTGRDAELVATVLRGAGMTAEPCADMAAICRGIARVPGAVLLAEEALSPAAIQALNTALRAQPPWSDLPIVLATGPGEHQAARQRTVSQLDPAGSVTILERPFRKLTFLTAFEAALRARRRQYQMRRMTAELVRAEQERVQAEALRRSEALYRALARNYPNGAVLLVDRSLRCVIAEGRGLADLDLSRAAEGRPVREALPAALRAHIERGCLGAALAGECSAAELTHDGRVHLVHCVPLVSTNGEIEAAMLVTQDITAQKHAEEELRRDAELRERFIGVLAHDLRTPLQAVTFLAATMAAAETPTSARRTAERVGRAAERMARMISDLLDLTRSRHSGGIPITPAEADLATICRRTIEEIQPAHPRRAIQLAIHGDTRGTWDADRIAQVVANLVGNAVTHSPETTPVAVEVDGAADEVVLAVTNQGAPIPPELITSIFEPFKRGPGGADGEQAKQGLGLGLFIADHLVRAHGGTIGVTSAADRGTTFTVALPRCLTTPPRDRREEQKHAAFRRSP